MRLLPQTNRSVRTRFFVNADYSRYKLYLTYEANKKLVNFMFGKVAKKFGKERGSMKELVIDDKKRLKYLVHVNESIWKKYFPKLEKKHGISIFDNEIKQASISMEKKKYYFTIFSVGGLKKNG